MKFKQLPVRTLVNGLAVSGEIVRSDEALRAPHEKQTLVFLTKRLLPEDYLKFRWAKACICEEGGETDHASIVCRIGGQILVLLEGASDLLSAGETVTVAPSEGMIYSGHKAVADTAVKDAAARFRSAVTGRDVTLQVSIVSDSEIGRANLCDDGLLSPKRFFLREELIWVSSGVQDPFGFVEKHGIEETSRFLKQRILACMGRMNASQVLNFRSLDARTDEFELSGTPREPNPVLGFHGIRRSIEEPNLLRAALRAASESRKEGGRQLLFSLPFINKSAELDAVIRIASEVGASDVPLAIFVETPAAVHNLPDLLDRGVVKEVFVGTKDLTQLILACDRNNARLAHMLDPKEGPVVAAIRSVVTTCAERGIPAVMFSAVEDAPFFLQEIPALRGLSICCGEYELICMNKSA